MPKAAHWERPAYPVGQEEANPALAPPHNVVSFFSSHLKPAPLILHTSSDIAQWEGPCRRESCLGSGTGDLPLGFDEGCLCAVVKNGWVFIDFIQTALAEP